MPCSFVTGLISMLSLLLAQCCYSPDEKLVLTGTSAEAKDSTGSLVVLSAASLEMLGEVAVDGSAVAVQVCVVGCRRISSQSAGPHLSFTMWCSSSPAVCSGMHASTRYLWGAGAAVEGACAHSTTPSCLPRVQCWQPRALPEQSPPTSCRQVVLRIGVWPGIHAAMWN